MNERQVVLDTETTGIDPGQGHRVIEIGCIELLNRRLTRRRFHVYLQPDRAVDAEAVRVHGLTNDFLASQPRFPDIADEFLRFVRGPSSSFTTRRSTWIFSTASCDDAGASGWFWNNSARWSTP